MIKLSDTSRIVKMSGYQCREGDYGRSDRYGGRDSRDRRDDRGGNNQERRRSCSPGRDHPRGDVLKLSYRDKVWLT